MLQKNPMTLALIVVIIILAFMLYCNGGSDSLQQFVKSRFADAPLKQMPSEDQAVDKPINMELPANMKNNTLSSEDKYQSLLLQPLIGNSNMSGIVSSNNVNSGLMLGEDTDNEVNQYKLSYQDIVNNEIGNDNIQSQKTYSKYVKNDGAMRYLDTDLSANYSNFYGLSLSRGSKANTIAATDSTQIQGIDASAYDQNQTNIREFYNPPPTTTIANTIIPTNTATFKNRKY